jgi:hypothetical protein
MALQRIISRDGHKREQYSAEFERVVTHANVAVARMVQVSYLASSHRSHPTVHGVGEVRAIADDLPIDVRLRPTSRPEPSSALVGNVASKPE